MASIPTSAVTKKYLRQSGVHSSKAGYSLHNKINPKNSHITMHDAHQMFSSMRRSYYR